MLRQWLFGKKIRLWLGAALLSGVCAAGLVYYLLTSFPTNWSNNPYLLGDKSITARIGPYAPYAFMDKAGTVDGYVTDMANAISRMMSVRIQLVSRRLDDTLENAGLPDADVVLCMVKTPFTSLLYDFSLPYAVHNFSIFGRWDAPPPDEKRRFHENPAFVINRDGVYHDLHLSGGRPMRAGLATSAVEAMHKVATGEYDYTIMETYIGNKLLLEGNFADIRLLRETDQTVEYAFAVRKGNTEVLNIFNEGLSYLRSSGLYDRIQKRWLEPRYMLTKNDRDTFILCAGVGLAVCLGLIFAFFLWSRTLKRQVRERTLTLETEIQERQEAERKLLLSQTQLIQADKMAAVGTLASGMAHEINNPNGLILLNLAFLSQVFADVRPLLEDIFRREGDFVLGGLSWPELREQMPVALEDTAQAALRIKNIVEDVKDFSRMDGPGQMDEVDLNQVVRTALHLLNGMLKKSTKRLEVCLDDNLPRLRGSAQKMEQVILNLVMNSCQALQDTQSAIRIRTGHDGESLYFMIQDEGTGIRPEHMPYLFDPFFTSKREEGGTGLGLSISDTIAKAHHGSLEITSQWGQGTTAILRLPGIPANLGEAAA